MKRKEIKELIREDFLRQSDKPWSKFNYWKDYRFHQGFRMIVLYRKSQTNNKLLKKLYKYKLFKTGKKFGCDFKSETQMGRGIVFIHPYGITISPYAVIGNNVNFLKGCTVGLSGGSKVGAPKIGNNVQIGINACVVGNITVGNDVVFAPNSFCNEDVPDHSIVIGNPCQIIHKENATRDYVHHCVRKCL